MADKQVHELKTDPDVFDAVYRGAKTHEIRYDDRGFRVGDELWLRETHWSGDHMRNVGKPLIYTGRECRRTVSHVLVGYGLQPGWCILSFASTPLQHPSTRPSSVEESGMAAANRKGVACIRSVTTQCTYPNCSCAAGVQATLPAQPLRTYGDCNPQPTAWGSTGHCMRRDCDRCYPAVVAGVTGRFQQAISPHTPPIPEEPKAQPR